MIVFEAVSLPGEAAFPLVSTRGAMNQIVNIDKTGSKQGDGMLFYSFHLTGRRHSQAKLLPLQHDIS